MNPKQLARFLLPLTLLMAVLTLLLATSSVQATKVPFTTEQTMNTDFDRAQFVSAAAVTAGSHIFTDSGQNLGSSSSYAVALEDVDSDGDLDAFVGNSGPNKIWLNDGTGILSNSGQSLGSSTSFSASLGDVDGDGDLDAFVGNNGANKVWLNNGTGSFTDSGQSLGSSYSLRVALGDMDGDGDLDAFVANSGANKAWLNDGTGTFTDSGQSLGSSYSRGVALGDVDGDGDFDTFVVNDPAANKVWLNDGSGHFSDSGQSLGSSDSEAVALGDLDGDGDLDAYVANASGSTAQPNTVWLNNSTGTFTLHQNVGGTKDRDIALGDIDGDGDLDAVTATHWSGSPSSDLVWINDGSGHFSDSGERLGSSWSKAVALGDVDGDADLDVLVGNGSGQANKLWLNQNSPTFSFSYEVTVSKIFGGIRSITGVGQVSDSDTSKLIATLDFNPYDSFFRRERIVSFKITEGATLSLGDLQSDVYLAEGDDVVAWIKLSQTPKLYASTRAAQQLDHDFSYELKATGTESPDVTFQVAFTASGREEIEVRKEFSDNFPRIEVKGKKSNCTSARRTVCLPQNCEIDFSRSYTTPTREAPFGQGGAGYGVVVNSFANRLGSGHAYYSLNSATKCLTSDVKVCSEGRWKGRSWYEAYHVIYGLCTQVRSWTQTQNQAPFTLDASDGFTHLTDYTGQIGSGASNVVQVLPDETTYRVDPVGISPIAAAPTLNLSMIQGSGNNNNGNQLWGLTTYTLPWVSAKQGTDDIDANDGVKHIDSLPVTAPDDNTVYKVSWIDSPANSGTTYTDRNNDDVVEAGDFQGWMSSLTLGSPPYDFFAAFGVEPPLAIIDSISPNPVGVNGAGTSLSVSFDGHGEQGTITGAIWRSNRPSPSGTTLNTCTGSPCNFTQSGLVPGQHLISFQVEALSGGGAPLTSPPATEVLRVNRAPHASITSIESTGEQPGWPNPTTIAIEWKDDQFQVGHDSIDFIAQAVDTDGTIASYRWESDRDGFLSNQPSFTANDLSIGMHTITFAATDNDGVESNTVTRRVRVMRPPTLLVHGACSGAGTWFPDEEITESGAFSYLGAPVNVPQRALDPEEVNSDTQVSIYTLTGTLIRTATIANGDNHFVWDGTDDSGSPVASGTYLYQLEFDEQVGNLISAYYHDDWLNINPNNERFNVGAQQVGDRVQTISNWFGVPKVNIVAHSLGGMNSRWYIQNLGYQDDVNKVVMLGTANHGMTLAQVAVDHNGSINVALDDIEDFFDLVASFGINTNNIDFTDIVRCLINGQAALDFIPQSAALQAINGNKKDEGYSGNEPDDNISTIYGDIAQYFNIWGGNLPSITHAHVTLFGKEIIIHLPTFKSDLMVHKRSARLDNVPSEKIGWRSHTKLTEKEDSLKKALYFLGDDPPKVSADTGEEVDISELLGGHVIYAPEETATISTGETQQQEFEVDAENNNLLAVLTWPEEEGTSLSLQLLSPSGIAIDENTTLPNVTYDDEGLNIVTYHITDTETGMWTAIIEPVSLSSDSAQYSLMALGETDFWVGMVEGERVEPGEPITITAYAQKDGSPMVGLDVTATLLKTLDEGERIGSKYGSELYHAHPEEIPLTDLGDGRYEAVISDTLATGAYRVFVTTIDPATDLSRVGFTTFFVEDEYELSIQDSDITFSNEAPEHNEIIRIYADVHNESTIDANGIEVWFTDGSLGENGEVIAKKTVDIPAGGSVSTSTLWRATAGQHEIFVIVSPMNSYLEANIDNNIASKTITLTDSAPVADAGSDQTARFDADSQSNVHIFLDGSGSTDDLGVEQYNWDIDTSTDSDGDTIPDNDVNLTGVRPFISAGTYITTAEYEVQLTVFDTAGQSSSDTFTVTVEAEYDFEPPTANAAPDQVVLVRTPVHFDGSGSADNYGIAIYSWDLDIHTDSNGDGVKDNDVDLVGKQPVLTAGYAKTGTYTVKLSVSDVAGNDTASDTMKVVVREGRDDCSVTIAPDTSLQAAIDIAQEGEILCVTPAVYAQAAVVSTNDLTLDCQGATLTRSTEVNSTVGINVLGSSGEDISGVSIENCQAEGFEIGFAAGFGRNGNQQVFDVQFLQNTATKNQMGFYSEATGSRFIHNHTSENSVGMEENGRDNTYYSNTIEENEEIGLHITSSVGGLSVNSNQACFNGNWDIARETAFPSTRNKGMGAIGFNSVIASTQSNSCNSALNWNDAGATGCRMACARIITPYDVLTDTHIISADIRLAEGTYLFPNGLEVTDSNVVITCEDGATIRGNGAGVGMTANGTANVVVNGCRFEGYKIGLSFSDANNVELTNIEIDTQNLGIELLNTDGVTLTASTIHGDASAVLIAEGSTATKLLQNHLTSAENFSATLTIDGNETEVWGNTIANGIHISGSGNQVYANTLRGEHIFSAITIEEGQGNRIAENDISEAKSTAILLRNTSNNEIVQNLIHHVSQDIFLENATDNTIISNTLRATEEGIVAINSTSNQILSNNASRKYSSGIELINSTFFTLQGNTLNENAIGILLIESDQNSISENTISDNAKAGLQVVDSSDNDFQNNELSGNPTGMYLIEELEGNPEDDVDPETPGIQILAGTTVTYTGSVPNPEAQNVSWEWLYIVDNGNEVSISSGTYPEEPVEEVTFTYPKESAGAIYTWILRTDDGQGVVTDRVLVAEIIRLLPPEPTISDVRTTNIRDVSFTVSWLTDVPASGEVHYGTDPANLNLTAYDDRAAATSDDTHYVSLDNLLPDTTYYFDVVSAGTTDDNGGAHYSATTAPTLGLPSSDTIYGQVAGEDGSTLAVGAIVYITLQDADASGSSGQAAALSALVDNSGYWSINLGNARIEDLSAYFSYSASGDQVLLSAQGAADGVGCERVDTDADSPATDIVLNVSNCSSFFPMSLDIGWTHISLPVDPITAYTASDVCDEINNQAGNAVEIDRWHNGGWDGHICGFTFNDFDLVLGSDYFIKSSSASSWLIEGYEVTEAVPLDLQVGWTSIGIPHTDGYSASSLCDEIISQGVTAVEIDRWHTGGWDGHICGLPFNDFNIERGRGYFIKSSSAGTVIPDAPATPLRQPAHAVPVQTVPVGQLMPVRELRVGNLSDSAVTLSWMTDEATTGYVLYGETPELGQMAVDVRGATVASKMHVVTLTNLKPETSYDFKVVSGAESDDDTRMTITTMSTLESLPASDTVYGQLYMADGVTPATSALVYLTLQDADGTGDTGEATLLSALVDSDGYWHANLGNARLADGNQFDYSASRDELLIEAQGADGGMASQTVDTANDSQAPDIYLSEANEPTSITVGAFDRRSDRSGLGIALTVLALTMLAGLFKRRLS